MKKTDLEKYTKLNEEFLSECDRVANILKDAPEYQTECGNISFANCFTLDDDNDVHWEGDEYWNYGGHEHHDGYFPDEYLTMSDEELKKIVDKKIEEYNKRQEEKKRLKREAEKQARLREYEKLKAEFGEASEDMYNKK